jgi:hypothetical protein
MFVGNRLAGLLTPLAMGALAGTLSVGEAMIAIVAPSAALLLLLGVAAVRGRSPRLRAVMATATRP